MTFNFLAAGRVTLERKAIAQLIGKVFIQKAAVNLLSTVRAALMGLQDLPLHGCTQFAFCMQNHTYSCDSLRVIPLREQCLLLCAMHFARHCRCWTRRNSLSRGPTACRTYSEPRLWVMTNSFWHCNAGAGHAGVLLVGARQHAEPVQARVRVHGAGQPGGSVE